MLPIPVRNLGARGIIKDISPVDLPIEAYTGGNNVRFNNGASMRSPTWRTSNPSTSFEPCGVFTYRSPLGTFLNFIPDPNGRIWQRNSGNALTDVSEVGTPLASNGEQYTGTSLGGVFYLNRETHVPKFFVPTSSTFASLPGWNSTHRCAILRAYKDFLVAFNVTKGANNFYNLVKWSDVQIGTTPPTSWDETDPTKLAGETPLAEMKGAIVDAEALRDTMIIYSESEVWIMEFVGGQFIFRFRRLFNDGGILNRNCAVEVNGKHFVFGHDDIYVHNGVEKTSISENRIRNYVYQNMNITQARRAFVFHNENTKEVYFCYPSEDQDVAPGFRGPHGVNRAVIYNYSNDTWGQMDMPHVYGPMDEARSTLAILYSGASFSYSLAGGTYNDYEGGNRVSPIAAIRSGSPGITTPRLSFLDPISVGSLSNFAIDPQLYTPSYLEKQGIDLDSLGAPLSAFKTVHRLEPQIRMTPSGPCLFRFGYSSIQNEPPFWEPQINFDTFSDYKVDTRTSGRYLALRLDVSATSDFALTGFDAYVTPNGRR